MIRVTINEHDRYVLYYADKKVSEASTLSSLMKKASKYFKGQNL